MPESLDAYAELRAMRARLEGIEHRQEMLVRAHADEILQALWSVIDKDPMLGRCICSWMGSAHSWTSSLR